MSPEQLGASTEVRMPVRELTGLEWRVGAAQEPVFTVPGIYRFILSPNLESEEIAYTCEVEFQPHRKRANNSSKPTPLRGFVELTGRSGIIGSRLPRCGAA
jgi:hypothetical protein